jgi:minor extracellular serine protease Vpr
MKAIKADSLVAPGSYSYGTFMKDKGNETKKETFTIETVMPVPLKEYSS